MGKSLHMGCDDSLANFIETSCERVTRLGPEQEQEQEMDLYLVVGTSQIMTYGMCCPSGHCWDYCPGALSLSEVSETHSKIEHPLMNLWVSDPQISCRDLTTW